MPSTWSQLLFHFVFSTKQREPFIDPQLQPRLYDYIGGTIRGERGTLLAIGGAPDHLHLLVRWRTDAAVSELMRRVKGNSSLWVHETFPDRHHFAWQEGYAVFSVSKSQVSSVKQYIDSQEEHHRERDFKSELLALLRAHDVEFDERYVFD
ncbi:MAG TPA: IS200/IS605 family transposase [Phycisphaerales bacterium]|nr:IS200/IS605 family transposase [Phycisphaerales bacterium]